MKYHKQMFYFETAKVRPTVEDTDFHGYVWAFDGICWHQLAWWDVDPDHYSHWMQPPKAPDLNDLNFE